MLAGLLFDSGGDFSKSGNSGKSGGSAIFDLFWGAVILWLLFGLAAPALLRQHREPRDELAQQTIARIGAGLARYASATGSYPSSHDGLRALVIAPQHARGWLGPYLAGGMVPLDPWGHAYLYHVPSARSGLEYDLCSLGSSDRNGRPGEPGLICND